MSIPNDVNNVRGSYVNLENDAIILSSLCGQICLRYEMKVFSSSENYKVKKWLLGIGKRQKLAENSQIYKKEIDFAIRSSENPLPTMYLG